VIGWLRGEVLERTNEGVTTVDVGGVGYEVHVPTRSAEAFAPGEIVELFVRTHVRDDAIILYGFTGPQDRSTFDLLLATPGVGPSTALGALSTLDANELAEAIAAEDVTRLATIPGIGRKTASRLILELSGKLPNLGDTTGPTPSVTADLTAALRQLGYGATEIRESLRDVELPDDDEGALRVALRHLGRQ
jgi:Holliday junction DNA helicase RuvA